MDLKKKLAQMNRSIAGVSSVGKKQQTRDLSHLLPGKVRETPCGSFWLNRTVFPVSSTHGTSPLEDFLKIDPEGLRFTAKDPSLTQCSLENLLFIDTETTGLSGGVGTLAFLTGIGYFDGREFVIEQYFLRKFSEEHSLLDDVFKKIEGIISRHGALVSYNGKSYDVPLLSNRAVLHRIHFPQNLPHIDLLHPARRLWKTVLPDCSLSTIETKILKVKRTGDIPSHLIPSIYFQSLRTSDQRPLLPVFYHNQMDILSMVSLLTLMTNLFSRKKLPVSLSVDIASVGRFYEETGDDDDALTWYENQAQQSISPKGKQEILLRRAIIYKRKKNFREAIRLWQEAIEAHGFRLEPYEELAKAWEHHVPDLPAAKEYTERALENISILEKLYPGIPYACEKESLRWRLQRLERKLRRKTDNT